ncbi:hypothetical protein [Kitasatospora purpeofusca]|uniref:hypothetical protein n=1 Tax=Kitasatospora purpeofusca TaxID=67352 RepID=UPI0012FF1042|nr:hypothetical protein [Kitasatospora purpeofusca]
MDSGIAAVVGAAIGVFGGAAGGWLTVVGQSRQQERQQRIDQQRHLEEVRREAYTACISASKQVSARWWRVAAQLRTAGSTPDQWEAAASEAHAAWAPFSTAVAGVTVVGPRSVAEAAEVLRRALYELDQAAVAWHGAAREAGHGNLTDFDDRYMAAVTGKREPGQAFQQAARETLNTER